MNAPALKTLYSEKVLKALKDSLGYKNPHQLPKILKVVINSGIKAVEEKAWIQKVTEDITSIAGQQAIQTLASKSISNFKLREGMPIGVKVTLRGERMWEFLDRLLNIALPNVRDFRGVPSKFDGNGNYTLGIKDHTIFPEINMEGTKKVLGMDITIVTSAANDEEGHVLLKELGMPFRKHSTDSDES